MHLLAASKEPAFRAVFDAEVAFVYRVLRYRGVRERDLEDATQEVFVIVHRRLHEHDPARSSLRTWLYGIAVNVARNDLRRARGREVLGAEATQAEPSEPTATPDDALEAARAREQLLAVLATLDEAQAEAFLLHDVSGVSVAEIAAQQGVPPATVYSRLRLARARIHAHIARTSGGDGP